MKNKDEYVRELHARIDAWNAEIDKLKAKADISEAAARREYQKQIDTLRDNVKAFDEKVSEIRHAGEGAWQDLKSGIDLAWESINEAIKSAAARLHQ